MSHRGARVCKHTSQGKIALLHSNVSLFFFRVC